MRSDTGTVQKRFPPKKMHGIIALFFQLFSNQAVKILFVRNPDSLHCVLAGAIDFAVLFFYELFEASMRTGIV
jgi:hypothetical protein